MPAGVHLKPARTYRPDPDLHARAKLAVAEVGSDMNSHINGFLVWLVGDSDELPPRPKDSKTEGATSAPPGTT
ncbi:hypothetical protein STBA_01690 [Streptomyces sp. MP131-18]|nr:hypothetical protein STBA_01690 [Streptomyces sp. MP131-18]